MKKGRLKLTFLFWLGFFFIVFYAALLWSLFVKPRAKFFALASRGTETTAEIVAYHPKERFSSTGGRPVRYTEHDYTIQYDGHKALKNLYMPRLAGSAVSVVYLPDDPGTFALGKRGMSASELFTRDNGGEKMVGFVLVVFIFFAGVGVWLCITGVKRIAPTGNVEIA